MTADYDVKIFGERNTSTNALGKIIRQNSGTRLVPSVADEIGPSVSSRIKVTNQMGRLGLTRGLAHRLREALTDQCFRKAPDHFAWKHAATRFADTEAFAGLSVLVTVRNPASWVLSLYKNPYHLPPARPRSLEAFLDYELPTVDRERLDRKSYRPLVLYAEKLKSYLAFFQQLDQAGIAWRIVPFETLVMDQPAGFDMIRDILRAPSTQFEALQSSTKSREKNLESYQAYYGQELWRDELGSVYDRIRKEFPKTLAGEFGYEL